MRHFAKERESMEATDRAGVYCGVKNAYGTQLSFDRAYSRWLKRRGLVRLRWNGFSGKQPEKESS